MAAMIIGIALIGLSVLLIFLRRKSQDKLLEIKSTQTSLAKDLTELWQSVKNELGSTGGFKQLTEVKGMVKCAKPLLGELSKQACVYYHMEVLERYEETYYEKDAQGNNQRRTRTAKSSVANNSQSVSFEIEDATGRITVNPNGADIDPVQVISKYEPSIQGRNSISFGSFSFNVGRSDGDRKILGYEFSEKIIPVDRRIYAIGEASDTSGELMIQKPSEKGKPFIITLKSEEELTKGTESNIKALMIGAILSLIAGLGAVIYGIIEK
ncbi:E3 ubiquitin ligase family protein [bacterium]|nr:E3 ubiquitin ligase family protein [bacterium]